VAPCDANEAVQRAKSACQRELAAARLGLAAAAAAEDTQMGATAGADGGGGADGNKKATGDSKSPVPLRYLPTTSVRGVDWMARLLSDPSCWARIKADHFHPMCSLLVKDSPAQQQLGDLTE